MRQSSISPAEGLAPTAVVPAQSTPSSRMVSVTSRGAKKSPLNTEPHTLTVLLADSTSSSTAVMVTASVLLVALAGMVRVLFALSVKSFSSAPNQ